LAPRNIPRSAREDPLSSERPPLASPVSRLRVTLHRRLMSPGMTKFYDSLSLSLSIFTFSRKRAARHIRPDRIRAYRRERVPSGERERERESSLFYYIVTSGVVLLRFSD